MRVSRKADAGVAAGFLHQLHEGKLAGAINGDIKVELALGSLDLGFSGLVPPSILGTRLMPWRPRPVSRKAEMG